MSTITIHTVVSAHTGSNTISLTTDSNGTAYYSSEELLRIDASLDSTDPTLTVTVAPPSVDSIRVYRVTGTSSGSYDASAGLSWSYSGSDLVFVFTRPSSGHEYTWVLVGHGASPSVKLTVKISRP